MGLRRYKRLLSGELEPELWRTRTRIDRRALSVGLFDRAQSLTIKGARAGVRLAHKIRARVIRHYSQDLSQRVTIKARVVRNRPGKAEQILRRHVRYLGRDDVGVDGKSPLFIGSISGDSLRETADGVARWSEDRHHFRFIISPENAAQIDLEDFSKRLVSEMESDLGTRLEWVATSHHNTGHPHVHLLIRGVRDDGQDLVLARSYISRDLRALARNLVTETLGLRTESELEASIVREPEAPRFTSLDGELLAISRSNAGGAVFFTDLGNHREAIGRWRRSLLVQRLKYLEQRGLATSQLGVSWTLDSNLAQKLRRLSEEQDIVKSLHRRLGTYERPVQAVRYDKDSDGTRVLIGRVLDIGIRDELEETKFLTLEATNGSLYSITLGTTSLPIGLDIRLGSFVRLESREGKAGAHVGRDSGRFLVVTSLSNLPLWQQVSARGATYLDELIERNEVIQESFPLAREIAEAITARRAWIGRNFPDTPAHLLRSTLAEEELTRWLQGKNGVVVARGRSRLTGRIVAVKSLVSGLFLIVDGPRGRTLALVPEGLGVLGLGDTVSLQPTGQIGTLTAYRALVGRHHEKGNLGEGTL